jgi:choline dehydrogenase-like flavoprotein
MGVKQIVLLAWASTSEVEEALAFDYHCWRDDVAHGRSASDAGTPAPRKLPKAPKNLHREGPATRTGAVPLRLLSRKEAKPTSLEPLKTLEWPELSDEDEFDADVVVVGSGAGGAVVAATLAERGLNVVVVEEGGNVDTERDFNGAVFDRFQRLYRDNGTTLVIGKPPIPLPLGRVVGGTTVVNAGTCFRAPDRVLERWQREYGLADVAGGALNVHYEPIEDSLNVRPVPWELLGPNAMAAHRGATALGMSGGPLLRNIGDCHGCGQCVFGCPTGAKQAMNVSYLPRAASAGTRILSHCRVDRVLIEDGRAIGVSASITDGRRKQGNIRVRADHVYVCAGAIHTPALLERSGVPDPSGQTGRNLRIHPASGVSGLMEGDDRYWQGTLQSYYIDSLYDSHELMFEATTAVPGVGAGSLPGIGPEAMNELALFGSLATVGFYVSDTSKGRVRRMPGGEVLSTYRMNALDARRYSIGVATAAEILLAAGAKKVYTGISGMDSVSSTAELHDLREQGVRPERMRLSAFHPMGTVRAGTDPIRSVVDPWGAHHAVANLWVADASTFPSCVGVNPQMTIMALAKRSAERMATEMEGTTWKSSAARAG